MTQQVTLEKIFEEYKKEQQELKSKWWGPTYLFFKHLPRRLEELKYWVIHRTIDRYNKIEIPSLEPGYYDKDAQMLHGMFDLLVDYVECELAWMQLCCSREEQGLVPWWQTLKSYRNKHGRELGLKHLDWETNLTATDGSTKNEETGEELVGKKGSQAWTAKEQKELYLWWKDLRQTRKPPYNEKTKRYSLRRENRNDTEDEKMLIRLAKIRRSLWT